MRNTKVYTDGIQSFSGVLPAPGELYVSCDGCGPRNIDGKLCMGTGVSLWGENLELKESWSFKHYSAQSTNIMAEFLAVRDALLICSTLETEFERICLWSDNMYTIDCFNGVYTDVKPHLVGIKKEWADLRETLLWKVSISWLPSKNNWAADIASRKLTTFPEGT